MRNSHYYYDAQKGFVIENFDKAKTFSSFLPGIAGVKGIPMWTFYVNRGQGICSFGIENKNSPIMEFSPASIAYRNVSKNGFRTFIKVKNQERIIEAFSPDVDSEHIQRNMYIKENRLTIEEINEEVGMSVTVNYFQIPHDQFAGLVRNVEITNLNDTPLDLEVVDGMPEVLPYGVENMAYKEVGNLLRSWMEVYNRENNIPFYHVRASIGDEAKVEEVTKGHFYLSFTDDKQLQSPIVDADILFGTESSLRFPEVFMQHSLDEIATFSQVTANKVPCAFTPVKKYLDSQESFTISSIIGHVEDIDVINTRVNDLTRLNYIQEKQQEADDLVHQLTDSIQTETNSAVFDQYCRQTYLDNVLRGGVPLLLENGEDNFVYHVFSRKHGDMERDYNFFRIAPEYYSQGNGNFRDANQNRRNDIFFNPKIGSFNVKMFMSLIQIDGYNPLSVEGCTFEIPQAHLDKVRQVIETHLSSHQEEIMQLLSSRFTPGKLMHYIALHQVNVKGDDDEFLANILSYSTQQIEASFGEGFWTDHWTYNLDHIESYLAIYPDQIEAFLFDDRTYAFFDSPVRVLPRKQKHVLSNGTVRQYGAIQEDEQKMKKLSIGLQDTNWLRSRSGEGDIYQTSLFAKLISLSLVKFSTLDPYGMGIEMEANKPGWNDALNGLPGLIGSGMSETFELKRLIQFMLTNLSKYENKSIYLPEEMTSFLNDVNTQVQEYYAGHINEFTYWDNVSTIRETFRDNVRFGITGKEESVPLAELKVMYETFLNKINQGIERAIELGDGLSPTYFSYEASDYDVIDLDEAEQLSTFEGLPPVQVKEFTVKPLNHFLEAPARALKTSENKESSLSMYNTVKETALFDEELKMYKTSVDLTNESYEIGRIKAFTPGWLERESVFLHMSYKYLLGLIKSSLYDEFFEEMNTSLIPFLDAEKYGRSTLENVSFIATSVNPDPAVHGQGFVARLSGSTAEFLSMWKEMMFGHYPFTQVNGELAFALKPILPGWLFNENGEVSATFLGSTTITYKNKEKRNTYGSNKAEVTSMKVMYSDGRSETLHDAIIVGDIAYDIRNGAVTSIEVEMS
ncbi:hypothetical protein [Pontibacillus yanchengensis]|uniref:Cellobiose phosphorylase n=1 Tax=Pontibacillus yanchengensis Y32 TaxID=1385514 RepID=A0A0A2TFR2_9BACI|nr:hypothetical protein [Pontibacillus yanchengensis]KGP73278.1 hypothetical protein N782_06605 [Pontibacillus yanchengensis Y32]